MSNRTKKDHSDAFGRNQTRSSSPSSSSSLGALDDEAEDDDEEEKKSRYPAPLGLGTVVLKCGLTALTAIGVAEWRRSRAPRGDDR